MIAPQALRDRAKLIREWEALILGERTPAPLDRLDTAKKLDAAAAEIERLRERVALLEAELRVA